MGGVTEDAVGAVDVTEDAEVESAGGVSEATTDAADDESAGTVTEAATTISEDASKVAGGVLAEVSSARAPELEVSGCAGGTETFLAVSALLEVTC